MWSTTTLTLFLAPHSGQYFLSNHSSKAGTKCVHCPILSVSDLSRAERTMMVGPTAAAVATPAPLRKVRRVRRDLRESAMRCSSLTDRRASAGGAPAPRRPAACNAEPVGAAPMYTKGETETDSRLRPAVPHSRVPRSALEIQGAGQDRRHDQAPGEGGREEGPREARPRGRHTRPHDPQPAR